MSIASGSATRIAHCGLPIATCWKRKPVDSSPWPSAGLSGKLGEVRLRAAHVDRAGRRARDRRADLAGLRLDAERVGVGPAVAAQVQDRLARAVARQLGLEPSGLKIVRRATKPGSSGWVSTSTPSAPGPKCGSHSRSTWPGSAAMLLEDEVVVAQRLPLLEPHGVRSWRPARRRRPPASGRSCRSRARRGACAATSAGAWRSGGSCVFIASTSPSSSSSKPSALRAVGGGAGARRASAPPRGAGREHGVDRARRSGRRARRGPSSAPPAASDGAVCAVHSSGARARAAAARGRRRAARAPGGCAGGRWARSRCATCSGSAACSCGAAGAASLGPALRGPRGDGGRRSSSASAARRYRPVPPTTIGRRSLGQQRVDLGVGALGVGAGREGLVDRHEAEQAVLEPRPLVRRSPRR